jgi:SAM-dependent MidA family methyltransferase
MSLEAELAALIQERGPLTVAEYVNLCLHHPRGGYYATRPAIGAEGDFITAPVISQMFGELVGLWAAETWSRLGTPARVILAEVGPGDGSLMTDLLRAGRAVPGFMEAAEVWLVEPSAPLKALQAERLGGAHPRLGWAAGLDHVPVDAPLLLVANEVLDCLPARQFLRSEVGWAERRVGLGESGSLAFGLAPVEAPPTLGVPPGSVVEHSPGQAGFAQAIAARIVAQGGCALLIDYGRTRLEPGDTLQALRQHAKVDPLDAPGTADLTMWAEFDVVAAAALAEGAAVAGPIAQGAFLSRLGLSQRAAALARSRPDRADTLARQVHRLTAPDQMGELFKAVAIHRAGDPVPPGFEEAP